MTHHTPHRQDRPRPRWWAGLLSVTAALLCWAGAARGQDGEPELVELNFPNEIEVQVLIDYVSDRIRIPILYDEQIQGRQVTVRAPEAVPVSSLLDILQSALRMKGLLLADAEVAGWKRVVPATRLADVAGVGLSEEAGGVAPVTEIFTIEHTDPQRLDTIIRPFLTQPGANSLVVPEAGLLIVTDYAANVQKIRVLVEAIDLPEADYVTEFYTAENLAAEDLVRTVEPIFSARPAGRAAGAAERAPTRLLPEARTNQVALVGTAEGVSRARELLNRFDVPLGLTTQVYQFQHVSAERVHVLFQELISPLERQTMYQATLDAEANLLIVHTRPELHERLDQLRQDLDAAPAESRSPVRFVRLRNANVDEVLRTLQSLGGVGELEGLDAGTGATPNGAPPPTGNPQPAGPSPLTPLRLPLVPDDARLRESGVGSTTRTGGAAAVLPGGVRISADPLTNSLVLVGPPSAQAVYLDLVNDLDRRRPQVMIEAHIVAVDTSDNFSLGVEISTGDREGAHRLLKFTSFGLSEVDPVTGALALVPGLGFNGTLVNPEIADIVVRALATHTRARVLASPKILVNDNVRGRLENVLSVPFQSVNASDTVATTSLGGNQQAGTTIDVLPHIKEGGELELEFSVEFSSFTGDAGEGLPPPRQVSRAESVVTIPDGYTVIVGGLKQVGTSASVTGIPFAERIPILRDLTSLRTSGTTTTSFFLFIRPMVVRDDRFAELRYLSDKEVENAQTRGRFPRSEPLMLQTIDE